VFWPHSSEAVMANRIDTVDARARLKPRVPPYWQRLSTGCHVGFRKAEPKKDGSDGTWLAQHYDPATQKQIRRSLGPLDHLAPGQRFDEAKKRAEELFAHLGKGGAPEVVTVKLACKKYVQQVRDKKGDDTADEIAARFARWVDSDKIASITLPKLRSQHLDEWRKKLSTTLVVVNPHAENKVHRDRSAATVNRDMTALRAALNLAHDHGHVTTDLAWRVALRPNENAGGRRDVYLDMAQRKALIAKAPKDLASFLQGLCIVPLRPGALASLTVGNYDKKLGVLTIGKDKAGRDRRIKLPKSTAAFFAALAADKLPGAPLLARAGGKAWDKFSWNKPVKEAVTAAELPAASTAYTLRHSVITDLVTGGLDLLTVAQLSGTSVAMIERHYGHLRADHAAAALATLAL
jgi:integrase